MKLLFPVLLALVLFSCTKQKAELIESNVFTLDIPVYEQESVSHYDVEISTNGQDFKMHTTFWATKDAEYLYTGDIDLSEHLKTVDLIYLRVKAVDIDTKFIYSPVIPIYKQN